MSQEGEDVSASSSSADLPFCFPALVSSPLQGEFLLGEHS